MADAPTLYLAWIDGDLREDAEGPWEELFVLRPGLALIRSAGGRSAVYHALKYGEAEGRSLLVAPLADAPKMKGMAPGAVTWARDRVGGSSHVDRDEP